MKPPKRGQYGDRLFVPSSEVVPFRRFFHFACIMKSCCSSIVYRHPNILLKRAKVLENARGSNTKRNAPMTNVLSDDALAFTRENYAVWEEFGENERRRWAA